MRLTVLVDTDNLPLLKATERVFKLVHLEARSLKDNLIDTGHLLMAILKDENNYATQLLNEKRIIMTLSAENSKIRSPENRADFPSDEDDDKGPFGTGKPGSSTSIFENHPLKLLFLIILELISQKLLKKTV